MKTRTLMLSVLACLALVACRATTEDIDWAPGTEPKPPGAPAGDLGEAVPTGPESDDPLAAPPDVAGPPATAALTDSGLASRVLRVGTGTRHPGPRDTVVVNYTGWQINGTRFDSSVARGEPAVFALNQVIPGWTEGLQLMVAGEKRRFWIPAALAYGSTPPSGAPAGMLVFDVELMGIR